MHDCQPWVSVLLTNRVSAPPFSLDQHCSSQLRKRPPFKKDMTDNWTKGNLQELCHNAYQELSFRFCVQNWRIKDKCLDIFISRPHERYLTRYLPNRLIRNKFIMHVRYFRRLHTQPVSLNASHICAHGWAVNTGRTHEACLVMLFNTHSLAPGSAPQVSH